MPSNADGGHSPGPPQPKSARTRDRLLDAAAAVLSRKGYSGTRLADIAEQAQVQAPAIYYYYASREDLVEEVMFVGASAMRTTLRAALDALGPDSGAVDRVRAAVEAHLRHELELSDYAQAIIRNANQLPEHVGRRAFEQVSSYYDMWRSLIAELEAAQLLRPDIQPSVARMLVIGSLNSATEWWDERQGPIEPLISTAQSMVLHALLR